MEVETYLKQITYFIKQNPKWKGLNQAIIDHITDLEEDPVQIITQSSSLYELINRQIWWREDSTYTAEEWARISNILKYMQFPTKQQKPQNIKPIKLKGIK